ncbi:MAG: Peptidoglycan-binding lysin domain protein [Clostridia bacterium]|jgi:LysM repeat protein|nr:Peptidoglycan-binding lysin domain protein [Clostridia bacterium]
MGKITYRPDKESKKQNNMDTRYDTNTDKKDKVDRIEMQESEMASKETYSAAAQRLTNIKPIGDLDCDYHIYLEDYVYTYLYQYALIDLSIESSAVFLGECCLESKEVIIRGIIPVPMDKLSGENEWIDAAVLEEIKKEKDMYFKDQHIIGWMHMQPGYGTMLTMKEVREHQAIFGEEGSIFMLVDAINKIETLFVYENEELKEQSGYYMYYERNENMQQYMLEHPFFKKEARVIEDSVVNQFREIGKLRKQEYVQRKNVNLTVIVASIMLIGLTAIIVKMNDTKNVRGTLSSGASISANSMTPVTAMDTEEEERINFIIQSKDIQEESGEAQLEPINSEVADTRPTTVAEEVIKEEIIDTNVPSNPKQEEIKATEKSEEARAGEKKYEEYTVKEGDTLADISYDKYGSASKSKEIAEINELGNTNFIRVGQTLKLPVD